LQWFDQRLQLIDGDLLNAVATARTSRRCALCILRRRRRARCLARIGGLLLDAAVFDVSVDASVARVVVFMIVALPVRSFWICMGRYSVL
jgi:hypothetical protein